MKDIIDHIVSTKFSSGCLVMLSGIMINMLEGNKDHLQPLLFNVRSASKLEPVDLLCRFVWCNEPDAHPSLTA